MVKPGSNDKKVAVLIAGMELAKLQRFTWLMSEAFGLDRRIENYQGKRPIGLYSWDFECLLAVLDDALKDANEYPDTTAPGYCALAKLAGRLHHDYDQSFGE